MPDAPWQARYLSLNLFFAFVLSFLLVSCGWAEASSVFSIEIQDPSRLPGNFEGGLSLVLEQDQPYCVGNLPQRDGQWTLYLPLADFQKRLELQVRFQGDLSLEVRDPSAPIKLFSLTSTSWKIQEIKFSALKPFRFVELVFGWNQESHGCVRGFELNRGILAFDDQFRFEKRNHDFPAQPRAESVLGINLEAPYLFLELNQVQREELLDQALRDGFNSLRIHKLFRVWQIQGEGVIEKFSQFLQSAAAKGFSFYLDLLSFPRGEGYPQGWKQAFFLESNLQERLVSWIDKLSQIKIQDRPLFQSPYLRFLCLVNENSLFYESNSIARKLLLRHYLNSIETSGFRSLQDFKIETMTRVYKKFGAILKRLGYSGVFFLSNYQAAGVDKEVNLLCSKNLDRHFYLDYPSFRRGGARVQNRSPLRNLDAVLQEIKALLPAQGGYISELNLPWPNRYQHELIPLLLAIHKTRKILGLWFYDYRLRNSDFHAGGLFGIQRFRSIIAQLPYFGQVWNQDYQLRRTPNYLQISSGDLVADSGWIRQNGITFPGTRWRSPRKTEVFSFEKAKGDRFELLGQVQTQQGSVAMELAPSSNSSFKTSGY